MTSLADFDVVAVDDHPPSLRLLAALLDKAGVGSVRCASNGAKALHELAVRCPDVLLVDWEMPGISGLDMVRFLRTSPDTPNRHLPVILVSGHTSRQRVLQARDAGINEFLVKPFTLKSVRACLSATLFHPRPFIISDSYVGPERRHTMVPFDGADRRTARQGRNGTDTRRDDGIPPSVQA